MEIFNIQKSTRLSVVFSIKSLLQISQNFQIFRSCGLVEKEMMQSKR
eukprot:UN22170